MTRGSAIQYSDAELFWIHDNHTRPRREAHAEFQYLWDRPDVSLSNFNALCKRNGWMTGRTGCFTKGQVPPNKGRKGYAAPGSEKGWFRKGTLNGRAAQLHVPIGTERLSKDGYRERKIRDDGRPQDRWRGVHLIRWEAENGPVPKGHRLKCLDGNRANTEPANWEALPLALAPRLNGRFGRGYDNAPAELKPTILATAKLEHAAREARKGAKS